MKQNITGLSQRYVAALRKYLKHGSRTSIQSALGLGRQAVTFGLETLALARIHERALVVLALPGCSPSEMEGMTRRAGIFFTEANAPIEETHRAARQGKADLSQMKETLGQRTEELAVSKRKVKRGVVRHKVMEEAYEKNGKRHDKSLEESLQLQNRLRQLTHKVLSAQEDERKMISHELQDEIAQTLLGINVRLLTLKQGDRCNTRSLKDEISSTQRLVAKSAKSVRRFARELDVHHPM